MRYKQMKKIMTVILLIALVFALTACDIVSGMETEKETHDQALTNIITAIKDVNNEELTKYGAAELIGRTDELNNTRNKKIFEKLEFNILSIDENENSARVSVEFKTKDLTTVPQKYADESVAMTNENNKLGDARLSDADMKLKYNDLFVKIVDECEYTEFKKVVSINMTKQGNSWIVELDSKLHNAIYGNLITAQRDVVWPGADNQQEASGNDKSSNVQNKVKNIVGRSIIAR